MFHRVVFMSSSLISSSCFERNVIFDKNGNVIRKPYNPGSNIDVMFSICSRRLLETYLTEDDHYWIQSWIPDFTREQKNILCKNRETRKAFLNGLIEQEKSKIGYESQMIGFEKQIKMLDEFSFI